MAARGRVLVCICALACLPGCGLFKNKLDESLLSRKPPADGAARLAEQYVVRFPDILDVQVVGRPSLCGRRALRVDGKIEWASGTVRVEGKTAPAIARLLAEELRLPEEQVAVRVAVYNSQHLLLQGEVKGEARSVPYVGPETVLEMLQRTGGITAGAAPGDIQVVRAHVAEGTQPEVFNVDLEAILDKNDEGTNLRLMPSDEVYVGQNRTSRIRKCLPPWLRPLYGRIFGLTRPDDVPEPLGQRRADLAERRSRRYTPAARN